MNVPLAYSGGPTETDPHRSSQHILPSLLRTAKHRGYSFSARSPDCELGAARRWSETSLVDPVEAALVGGKRSSHECVG